MSIFFPFAYDCERAGKGCRTAFYIQAFKWKTVWRENIVLRAKPWRCCDSFLFCFTDGGVVMSTKDDLANANR